MLHRQNSKLTTEKGQHLTEKNQHTTEKGQRTTEKDELLAEGSQTCQLTDQELMDQMAMTLTAAAAAADASTNAMKDALTKLTKAMS